MSTIPVTTFLRRALLVDAVATSATGLLLAVGAPWLTPLLGLPSSLLKTAGVALLPFAAFVAWLGMRSAVPRTALRTTIWTNAAWVVASVVLVAARLFEPTMLGVLFILAQAAAVLVFAELQRMGLRRARA